MHTDSTTSAGRHGLRALVVLGMRFLTTGAVVTCVYLGLTALLAEVAGLPFQLALAIGYFTAVAVHFTLHRGFTFASEAGYALDRRSQLLRFVVLVLIQYAVTSTAVALLPGPIGLDPTLVWLVVVGVVTVLSFVILKAKLFHPAAVTLDR